MYFAPCDPFALSLNPFTILSIHLPGQAFLLPFDTGTADPPDAAHGCLAGRRRIDPVRLAWPTALRQPLAMPRHAQAVSSQPRRRPSVRRPASPGPGGGQESTRANLGSGQPTMMQHM